MECAASTDPIGGQQPSPMLDSAWQLSESVALRPEPFGALAYHFGNRKLTFLKRPELVALVRALGESQTIRQALADTQIAEPHWPIYLAALQNLAHSQMITPQQRKLVAT